MSKLIDDLKSKLPVVSSDDYVTGYRHGMSATIDAVDESIAPILKHFIDNQEELIKILAQVGKCPGHYFKDAQILKSSDESSECDEDVEHCIECWNKYTQAQKTK